MLVADHRNLERRESEREERGGRREGGVGQYGDHVNPGRGNLVLVALPAC